jgi:hypothetical protein
MELTTDRESLKPEEVEENGRSCSNERRGMERRPYRRATGNSLEAIAGRLLESSSRERFK